MASKIVDVSVCLRIPAGEFIAGDRLKKNQLLQFTSAAAVVLSS